MDRDGVINASGRHRFVKSWDQFRFLPGVLTALKKLNADQRLCIVVSNQSGVGRKMMSKKNLSDLNRRMTQAIRASGGRMDAVYTCPHRPEDGCDCRKPRLGMIRRAMKRFPIDLSRSFMVGDNEVDIALGKAAGCRTILVLSGKLDKKTASDLSIQPDRIAQGLLSAVRWILKEERTG